MKAKVLVEFIDKVEKVNRKVGEEFSLSKERFEEINKKALAKINKKIVEEVKAEKTKKVKGDK